MSVINTNIKALAAQDSSRIAENKLSTAMQRLSTGLRINSAKDDAAGLAITTRMTAQVRGLNMAIRNANDGISLTQTAEGAIGQVADMLQRMRELAVQASNGTLTASDRAALQTEVAQLKKEVDNIGTKTAFNTIQLLDGSAKKLNLQTGINEGDTMTVGFDSVMTKDIGIGTKAAVTSIGGTVSNFGALDSGALLLNGVSVGASLSTDDTASYTSAGAIPAAASAIAKVAAINRVSEQSGVYAKVSGNTIAGAAMTAASTSGALTINGVATSSIDTTTDTSVSRARVVAAINAITNQTGVTAVDTQDDALGVTLVAADGRNVTVAFGGTLTSAASGVAAGNTYVGTYDLFTKDGSSFTVEQAFNTSISSSGLHIGTYQSGVATNTTFTRSSVTAGVTPASSSAGVLNGNTLIINDVQITAGVAGDDTSSYATTASSKAASAIAIAAAINKKSDVTGVTATANANVLSGSGWSAGTAGTVWLNGSTINVSSISRANVITALNSYSAMTGVKAVEYGSGVRLVAEDGRNIVIGSDLTAANLGLTGVTIGAAATSAGAVAYYSSVTMTSEKSFQVRSGSEGKTNFELLGFRTGTFGGSNNGTKVADLDISSVSGAGEAITVIDSALETVNLNRANAGAFNNRLDAVVNNLSTMNENITASRSRILDTDYATETTNLARNQIIQQAATAMLAQANQSAQTVLALLK